MSVKENVIRLWKTKGQILEGITNSIFKKEDVEQIAEYRMKICNRCPLIDKKGEGCMILGTAPCCNQNMGGCGCSLNLKTRSLSSSCPQGMWDAELTQEEEDKLNQKLGV
jgi:hypothetical protein